MTSTHVDANVPIYAFGRPHPLQEPCREIIRMIGHRESAFSTDAEVLQELLHRWVSLRIWPDYRNRYYDFARLMAGSTAPVLPEDAVGAARLADRLGNPSARDLIHVAVMRRIGVSRIVTADTGFDAVPGIERLDPARIADWRGNF